MTAATHTPGQVAEMPFHDGDGYSWGGDIIVTFGDRAVNFGSSQNYNERQKLLAIARTAAASFELLEALQNMMGLFDNAVYRRKLADDALYPDSIATARAAIAKATGQ